MNRSTFTKRKGTNRRWLAVLLMLVMVCNLCCPTGLLAEELPGETQVTEVMTEAATVASTEHVPAPASEPVTEIVTEAATEKVTEAVTEKVTEQVTEKVTEAATETVTEAATEMVTEKVTEDATESVTEAGTEGTTEGSTEAATEQMTEGATETEKVTEAATEAVTEAIETEAVTEKVTEAVTEAELDADETSAAVDELYNRLMACTTYDELSEMMDNMTEEEYELLGQFSAEQNAAFQAKVDELSEAEALAPDDNQGPPDGDDQGGGYELSMEYFKETSAVYWQVMTGDSSNGYSVSTNQSSITGVTLAGTDVTAAGTAAPPADGGTALSKYYPNITNESDSVSKTLSITPAAGYYVTRVIVACCGRDGESSQYECNTWKSEMAYEVAFDVTNLGTVSLSLPSEAFGHKSESDKYVILICVAPIPTPLYVEYDYGTIGTLLGDDFSTSEFATADGWTDDNSGNKYKPTNDTSDGGIVTEDTQFKYTYTVDEDMTDAEKAEAVKSWSHTTNTITSDAALDAAEIGYYFTGWAYTYYSDVTVTENGDGAYNNYTYAFDSNSIYGSGNVGANSSLELITNVKLVAQWTPVAFSVNKIVSGLIDGYLVDHTYKLQVQKQDENGDWVDFGNTLSFTVNGNGEGTAQTISPVTPGTYRIVELVENGTTDYGYLDLSDGSTVMYVTVTVSDNITITASQIASGTVTGGTLTVTNSYDDEPAKNNVLLEKKVTGNMGDWSKDFLFKITYKLGDDTGASTVNLANGDTTTIQNIPVGATVTITESDADGYKFSIDSVSGVTTYSADTDAKSITFTMPASNVSIKVENNKEVTIDTGILLDSLPYILILVIVIAGVIIMVIRKRRMNDDY